MQAPVFPPWLRLAVGQRLSASSAATSKAILLHQYGCVVSVRDGELGALADARYGNAKLDGKPIIATLVAVQHVSKRFARVVETGRDRVDGSGAPHVKPTLTHAR